MTAILPRLHEVTPDQACAHPNWVMGRKISVDSATMMNKALEVIEARYLFGMPPSRIEVVIHPQSVIHSMVQYRDNSVVAQLGTPDMRVPIAYGLSWPARMVSGADALDFHALGNLTFEAMDSAAHQARFPGSGWPGRRWMRPMGRRRCSTPPTRLLWRRSWQGRSALTRFTRSTTIHWAW